MPDLTAAGNELDILPSLSYHPSISNFVSLSPLFLLGCGIRQSSSFDRAKRSVGYDIETEITGAFIAVNTHLENDLLGWSASEREEQKCKHV